MNIEFNYRELKSFYDGNVTKRDGCKIALKSGKIITLNEAEIDEIVEFAEQAFKPQEAGDPQ